ncbi:MAG: hypothetical protein M3347_14755, partial [Armatimonadota bacterium]|nr:hypothetical protein [Armatimonadota bacterium]
MKHRLALIMALLATVSSSSADTTRADTTRVVSLREFAPAEGIVKAPEKPQRRELCLNGSWQFQPVVVPQDFVRDTGMPPELAKPNA